jgi:hypothetical protein
MVTTMADDDARIVRKDFAPDLVYKTHVDAMIEPAESESDATWNTWFDERFDQRARATVISAVGDVLGELHEEIRRLEREVAELKGELRAMRGMPKLWRPGE